MIRVDPTAGKTCFGENALKKYTENKTLPKTVIRYDLLFSIRMYDPVVDQEIYKMCYNTISHPVTC